MYNHVHLHNVNVFLLMVPAFSMSAAKCIFTSIHPMVQFQLLNGTCIFNEYRYSFIYIFTFIYSIVYFQLVNGTCGVVAHDVRSTLLKSYVNNNK